MNNNDYKQNKKKITQFKAKNSKNSNIYQENSCLRKVTADLITNILGHTTKLIVIRPLICMKISNYVQPFSRKMFLYLSHKQLQLQNENKISKLQNNPSNQ